MTSPAAKVGRNELCNCGSGKKYKRCCGTVDTSADDASARFFGVAAVLAGVMGVVGIAVLARATLSGDAGKRVWSAEHGHYHTAGGAEPGSAGPGKVWNEAHGHYHDVAAGSGTEFEPRSPNESALEGFRASKLAEVEARVQPKD